ncbi:hypothetical protein H7X46_02695 [Pseudonocardia sp. C8]|uniref:hypothetical protein n=1 Tax=Pseudonocardia sp. C8 TaxID=2762759 RepID=UPI0016426FA2|nr:hypothetical protein [Pseudonocardia sp. C8]MBC3189970.1 hypothetical protein [Pseudonocardia sp. C8]
MTRRTAVEWRVPDRRPQATELDARLLEPTGRTGRLQVLVDHDSPAAGRCPGCGWVSTSRRGDCPSRVIALSLLERKPLPAWLAHLVGVVPGARVKRDSAVDRRAEREALDGWPGLFEAPVRVPEPRRPR